jgi:hypothetical protein
LPHLTPALYSGDPLGPIPWPEDFPLAGLPRVGSPDQADLLLFPWYWQAFDQPVNPSQLDPGQPQLADALAQRLQHLEACSRRTNKPLLLFRYHDAASPLPHRHGWVWRTSLEACRRQATEAALPAFHPDVVAEAAALAIATPAPLPWQPCPSVGFCGQAMPLHLPRRQRLKAALRTWLGRPQPGPQGYWLRRSAMRHCLRAQPQLSCHFLLTDPSDPLAAAAQKQRFLANIFSSAYVLCGSGYGNYSYRFYEALSAGRIPVLLDTDVVLPFDHQIPWRELIVQVPAAEVHQTPQRILAFHRQFTPAAFLAHQRRLRKIWEQFCTQAGFQRSLEQELCRRWQR